jgi:biotin-(acetyl-CoA carboxylase) ligase
MFLGSAVDRTELLITLCKQFSAIAETPATSHRLYQEWRSRMSTLGERVVVYPYLDNALSVAGQAVDVTPHGELIVVDDAGVRHVFDVGDVSIRATG